MCRKIIAVYRKNLHAKQINTLYVKNEKITLQQVVYAYVVNI